MSIELPDTLIERLLDGKTNVRNVILLLLTEEMVRLGYTRETLERILQEAELSSIRIPLVRAVSGGPDEGIGWIQPTGVREVNDRAALVGDLLGVEGWNFAEAPYFSVDLHGAKLERGLLQRGLEPARRIFSDTRWRCRGCLWTTISRHQARQVNAGGCPNCGKRGSIDGPDWNN